MRHKLSTEAGLHIKERKTSWQKSFKESQRMVDELVQQTAALRAATRVDNETKTALQDCFDTWARSCDDAEVAR